MPLSWILGLMLCALAGGQVALWSTSRVRAARRAQQIFRIQQQDLRSRLRNALPHAESLVDQIQRGETWQGFRHFLVDRLVNESDSTMSVYLTPADGKSIPGFEPGQHITLRLNLPGRNKPVVRCYSLSDSPEKPYYRISVKVVAPPTDRPELGFGKASSYINHQLCEGQLIEVKAPAGEFYLRTDSNRLAVLLAGGIGITPMLSMLNHLTHVRSNRTILFVHGVRHGGEHAFKATLADLMKLNPRIHGVTCYSQARPQDQRGTDYQVDGQVSLQLLQRLLSHPDAEFYLCGPPAFMKSLYEGLLTWGARESDIHFEAFGPASIVKPEPDPVDAGSASTGPWVKFKRSDLTVPCTGQQTLLELAESLQVSVESGCRAGSCGTCSVALLRGEVSYPAGQKFDCPPGQCLMCVARPRGEGVELDV